MTFHLILGWCWQQLHAAQVLCYDLTGGPYDPWVGTAFIDEAVLHAPEPVTYGEAFAAACAASPFIVDQLIILTPAAARATAAAAAINKIRFPGT